MFALGTTTRCSKSQIPSSSFALSHHWLYRIIIYKCNIYHKVTRLCIPCQLGRSSSLFVFKSKSYFDLGRSYTSNSRRGKLSWPRNSSTQNIQSFKISSDNESLWKRTPKKFLWKTVSVTSAVLPWLGMLLKQLFRIMARNATEKVFPEKMETHSSHCSDHSAWAPDFSLTDV